MAISKMTQQQLFSEIRNRFLQVVKDRDLSAGRIDITSRALSPKDAIGTTKRQDYPIITGKEVMLQADYMGSLGQAFTDSPSVFEGTLADVLALDIENDVHARGLFIASLNAVMRHLALAEGTIHCKNEEPELCAAKYVEYINENYGNPKIALVGFQPALIENLSKAFDLRVLDLNPENIGKTKHGVKIEDGEKDYREVVLDWAELVVCTGSTLANGSIVKYIGIGKEVVFYGTTLSGAAALLGLKRVCFYGA